MKCQKDVSIKGAVITVEPAYKDSFFFQGGCKWGLYKEHKKKKTKTHENQE